MRACSVFPAALLLLVQSAGALRPASRRHILQRGWAAGAAFGLVATAPHAPAQAFSLFGGSSPLQQKVDAVLQTRPQLELVKKMLQTKELKGGAEDSQTVFRYTRTYFQSFPGKMADAVAAASLSRNEQERLAALPEEVKGHVADLEAACKSQSLEGQIKEVNDISGALDEFFKLVADKVELKKTKELLVGDGNSDAAAYYGPFGCEFYGLKRKIGSNQCVDEAPPATL